MGDGCLVFPEKEGKEQRQRCKGVELYAVLLLVGIHLRHNGLPSVIQAAFDCAGRRILHFGNLSHGKVFHIVKQKCLPLLRGKEIQHFPHNALKFFIFLDLLRKASPTVIGQTVQNSFSLFVFFQVHFFLCLTIVPAALMGDDLARPT